MNRSELTTHNIVVALWRYRITLCTTRYTHISDLRQPPQFISCNALQKDVWVCAIIQQCVVCVLDVMLSVVSSLSLCTLLSVFCVFVFMHEQTLCPHFAEHMRSTFWQGGGNLYNPLPSGQPSGSRGCSSDWNNIETLETDVLVNWLGDWCYTYDIASVANDSIVIIHQHRVCCTLFYYACFARRRLHGKTARDPIKWQWWWLVCSCTGFACTIRRDMVNLRKRSARLHFIEV